MRTPNLRSASLYERGEGVAQDHNRAMEWYRRAADQGNEAAQEALDAMDDEE